MCPKKLVLQVSSAVTALFEIYTVGVWYGWEEEKMNFTALSQCSTTQTISPLVYADKIE